MRNKNAIENYGLAIEDRVVKFIDVELIIECLRKMKTISIANIQRNMPLGYTYATQFLQKLIMRQIVIPVDKNVYELNSEINLSYQKLLAEHERPWHFNPINPKR